VVIGADVAQVRKILQICQYTINGFREKLPDDFQRAWQIHMWTAALNFPSSLFATIPLP
jgi:hypothetical protein